MSGFDLSNIDLTGANLTGANLTGANLTSANLTGATLTGIKLDNANLTNCKLAGVKFNERIGVTDVQGIDTFPQGTQHNLKAGTVVFCKGWLTRVTGLCPGCSSTFFYEEAGRQQSSSRVHCSEFRVAG